MPSGWQPPALGVDVVILAGDIGLHTQGIEWAADTFLTGSASPIVLYVAGNHEYYDADIYELAEDMRQAAKQNRVVFLDNDAVDIAGVRFLGTTLWTDFRLYGSQGWTARSINVAKSSLSDYSRIRKPGGVIEPDDTIALHRKAAAWLSRNLAKPFPGKTAVITHFAPHRGCVAAEYDGDVLTPYFVVDMEPLMSPHRIDLWAFGHTHYNVDFVTKYGCRVVSNQLGYPLKKCPPSSGFCPTLTIEL